MASAFLIIYAEFEPFWPSLFANALAGRDVKDLLSSVGTASAAPAGGASTDAPAAEEKKEEAPAEESDEDDDVRCTCWLVCLIISHLLSDGWFLSLRLSSSPPSIDIIHFLSYFLSTSIESQQNLS